MFNASQVKDDIIQWIRDWFAKNGADCNAIIGLSGGKDSTIVAALCVEALGNKRVIGVNMPGKNADSGRNIAFNVAEYLDIPILDIEIASAFEVLRMNLLRELCEKCNKRVSEQTVINLPARLRMATLYAVSQSLNGRVANTCNLSEDYIGYATRWGDSVGDFSPLSNLTVTEVKQIGYALNLQSPWIEKVPSDGLCGKTDEESFGFSYEILDKYIRTGSIEDEHIKNKIDSMHEKNLFKLMPIPSFPYTP